ncbi:tRNA guanosine(34) transglycosylase Tgt [bacterium]|nr:MAG: tRNA guanosine(34) transglycosylase Tgt [bacterium]
MITFELVAMDSKTSARAGILHTPHGDIPTPVFMPVGTQATVKTLPVWELKELGARIILNNIYHLYLRPGIEKIVKLGGLHSFQSWDGAILTDSGGFQLFSLPDLRKVNDEGVLFQSHFDGSYHFITPEKATEIQFAAGADIIMAFDDCISLPASIDKLEEAVDRTISWAKRCKEKYIQLIEDLNVANPPSLFGIYQGGTDIDLRKKALEEILDIDFPGIAIGGLSVGEAKDDMLSVLEETVPIIPEDKPRYLMGVGKPTDIMDAVTRGIDMFDCVLPTRNARNGSVYTWKGKLIVKAGAHATDETPIDPDCSCKVCKRYSKAYIRHLFNVGELLAPHLATYHTIYFYLDFIRKMREAIIDGNFSKFCERFRSEFSEKPDTPSDAR